MTYDFKGDPLPARNRSMGEPRTVGSLDGLVLLFIDTEAFDFHIDAKPGFDPWDLTGAVTQAEWWGLEDMEECETEFLPDGTMRRYLTPTAPVNNTVAFMRDAVASGYQRSMAVA